MNLHRLFALLLIAPIAPGTAAAQQVFGGHDQAPQFVLGAFAPSTPGVLAEPQFAPVCIDLPPGDLTMFVEAVDGDASPAELAEILGSGGARAAAARLAREIPGLLTQPRPGQAAVAIREFNTLVLESSEEFLRNPPLEFLAVHAIVTRASTAIPVPEEWACAPPVRLVLERPIEVCVLLDDDLQIVTAMYRPETGDTVMGDLGFREVYPTTAPGYAANEEWFVREDSMAVEGRLWVKFGVTRVVQPETLVRIGSHRGVPLFAEAGTEPPLAVLYVPVRQGCEVQPYNPREAIRPRGG